LAGGLPPEKFLAGIFWAGFGISCLALLANETFIPPTTSYARTVFREKIRRLGSWQPTVFTNNIVAGADGRLWTAQVLDESTGKMERVIVDQFSDGNLISQINAGSAFRQNNAWTFKNGVIRTYGADGTSVVNNSNFSQKVFQFSEKPSDFVIQEPQPEEMTYKKLKRHIQRMEMLGVPVRPLQVELMMKLSFPFACFVVTFLGVPLALQGKGSRAIGIAAGGILTLFYLGFMQFGKAMAQRLVPPWAGAWLGNVVFLLVGLFLWRRMRRSA
jgi:lipopolysaccharide export system permease protein